MSLSTIKFINLLNEIESNITNDPIVKMQMKIVKKIEIIKLCYFNNFKVASKLFNDLDKYATLLKTVKVSYNPLKLFKFTESVNKNYTILNKILGDIVHNIYAQSEYNLILTNVPETQKLESKMDDIDGDDGDGVECDVEFITSQHIYDTMCAFTNDENVIKVLQITSNTYLIKVKDVTVATHLIDTLHGNFIHNNVIDLSYIVNTLDESHPILEPSDTPELKQITELALAPAYKSYKSYKSYIYNLPSTMHSTLKSTLQRIWNWIYIKIITPINLTSLSSYQSSKPKSEYQH